MTKVNIELDLTDQELAVLDEIVKHEFEEWNSREKYLKYLVQQEVEHYEKGVVNLAELRIYDVSLEEGKYFTVTIEVHNGDCYDLMVSEKDEYTQIETPVNQEWR